MSHSVVVICWYAIPNANQHRGGFMPVYDLNGQRHGHAYGRGYDLDEALKIAEADARDEAAHYVGDWDISVAAKGAIL